MSWARRQLRDLLLAPVHFWSKPVRAEPLAAFRIAIGVCLFGSIALSFLPRVDEFAGEKGLCPLESAEPWFDRNRRVCLLRGPQHVPCGVYRDDKGEMEVRYLHEKIDDDVEARWRAWGDRPDNVKLLTRLWLVAIAAMTFGFGTRLATFVVWVMTISFHNRFSWVLNGGDALSRIALFYLLIAPAGKAWSIDAAIRRWFWRRRGHDVSGPAFVPAWTVRLPQIQIAVVYFCTGFYKVWAEGWGEDWINGTAVYWMFNDVALTRYPYTLLQIPMWACQLMSWGTIAFELGFPLLVLSRWTRPLILVGGVFFHFGILLATEVGWFSMASVAWYPLFLKGETLQRFAHRLFPPRGQQTN